MLSLGARNNAASLTDLAGVDLQGPISDAVERVLVASQASLAERKRRAASGHTGTVAVRCRVAPDYLVVLVDQGEARVDGDLVAAAQIRALCAAV